jgi:glycosyltransferase involved in cell wall biosynthesis
MKISIIVPLYHGKKYINSILKQVGQCAGNVAPVEVELILYNDSPDEEIYAETRDELFEMKVFNPGINSGIHGARVRGLENATGEYVVFLDQDDRIAPTYLKEQLECIKDADAVVCRLIHNNRLYYTKSLPFEKVITKEYILYRGNAIVSPGQVLIRKASIPAFWKEHILQTNGADDFFLWICMFGSGKRVALNQEVLFEHVVNDESTSGNTNLMMDSELEMLQLLIDGHFFPDDEVNRLRKLPNDWRKIHVAELDNYKNAFAVVDGWMDCMLEGVDPAVYLREQGITTVAIYGAGHIGKSIQKLLKKSGVRVAFYLDQNAGYLKLDIPAYTIEESPTAVDGVIISLFREVESIEKDLKEKFSCPIYHVKNMINDCRKKEMR